LAETDRTGRISKCGDGMLRSYLYEAASTAAAAGGVAGGLVGLSSERYPPWQDKHSLFHFGHLKNIPSRVRQLFSFKFSLLLPR